MTDERGPALSPKFGSAGEAPVDVLLIEPEARAARLLRESVACMTSGRFRISFSRTLEETAERLTRQPFAAILLSLSVPEAQDLELSSRIRDLAPLTPVIILAESDSEVQEARAARFAPQDYIVKSKCDSRILSRVIRHAIERKRIDEALRQSEQRYKRLLASTTDYIYTVQVENGQSLPGVHGPGCVKVTGYGPQDYADDPHLWYRMIHSEDRSAVTQQIAHVLAGMETSPLEHRIVHRDGSIRWVRNTAVPRFDERGEVISYDGLISDVSERKLEEERRRRSEEGLQAIIDNSPAVIYLKDCDGRYLMINRQFEHLFHVVRDDIKSKTDYDVFPRNLAEAFRANDREVFEGRTASQFEEVVPHDDGLHTYVSMKFPVRDVAGVSLAVCGISTDITARKLAETQLVAANSELKLANAELTRSETALRKTLQQLNESHEQLKTAQLQLIQAEKLECIGTLAAGVAHEVKNPLQTMLMGLAYLEKSGGAADENVPMVLRDMRDAVYRADVIVRDLLQFAAASHLDMADNDLNSVVSRSLNLVNYELVRAHVTLVCHLAENLPAVRLDVAKMEQVFINLYLNAAHAMPEGGTLSVRTRAHRSNNGERFVIAEVQDSGSGIPEASLPRVFEPFFTTKPPGVGTGLGLPVSKQIIELHGGTIDVQNVPSGGVLVTLSLRANE